MTILLTSTDNKSLLEIEENMTEKGWKFFEEDNSGCYQEWQIEDIETFLEYAKEMEIKVEEEKKVYIF